MFSNPIYREAFKDFVFIVLAIALTRVSRGAFAAVLMAGGVFAALNRKTAFALKIFILMPFLIVLSPILLPKTTLLSYACRFGPLLIGLVLALMATTRRGKYRLPFGWLLLYLIVAALGSIDGYAPLVSYMKLVNFLVFLIGIWLGTQNLQHEEMALFKVRAFMLAIVTFIILGSAALWPFPGLSTMSAMQSDYSAYLDAAMMKELMGDDPGISLFCGVVGHSQSLAPILCGCFGWVLADMAYVERHFRWPHGLLLTVTPLMLYATRSRVGLVTMLVALFCVAVWAQRHIRLSARVKMRITHFLLAGIAVLLVSLALSEIRNQTLSRWLRKTNDVRTDERTLGEALTASRQGLIDMMMEDFAKKPALGTGFQVAEYHKHLVKHAKGLILSAPIEKGLLPLMVLSETGLVGAFFFTVFLYAFYVGCKHKKLIVTMTLFTVFLATNMGEATFFSPGGIGGILWVLTVLGGYIIDMSIVSKNLRLQMLGLPPD